MMRTRDVRTSADATYVVEWRWGNLGQSMLMSSAESGECSIGLHAPSGRCYRLGRGATWREAVADAVKHVPEVRSTERAEREKRLREHNARYYPGEAKARWESAKPTAA